MNRGILFFLTFASLAAICCPTVDNFHAAESLNQEPDEFRQLPNLLRVSKNILCGGEPQGSHAFARLAAMGVKTIVSVDGARPRVKQAEERGLRYVHIPIGYGGISERATLALTRVVRELDGSFYIHCHHGQHRGPAAAAIACMVASDLQPLEAQQILERAGTCRDYSGLWQAVASFKIPPPNAELPALVSIDETESSAWSMANIDRALDRLDLCREAGWATPADHPDLVPLQQALLVKEGLREFGRNCADEFADPFSNWIVEAENTAQEMEDALRGGSLDSANAAFRTLTHSCQRCHEQFRD